MEEIWKDVVGYEGIYEVSNKGRVRTHKDKTTYTKMHGIRHWKQRVLSIGKNKKYCTVTLTKDNVTKNVRLHRIVAWAFIPTITGKNCVNHIDGNTENNIVTNLEWCTHKENNIHAYKNGLKKNNMRIKLISENGSEYIFTSAIESSYFLNRSHGYVANLLRKGKNIAVSKNNEKYKIKKLL